MFIEVRNPATGEIAGKVSIAAPETINQNIGLAREAQQRWVRQSFRERARILRRFRDLILDRQQQVLDTIQSETGKARRDAFAELVTVAGTARYYLAHGQDHLSDKRGRGAIPLLTKAEVVFKPHGVVGLITPWNYPFLLGVADALPALLAGNAVIVKPSELTPLSAVLARELLLACRLDPNLFIVVNGKGESGAELIRHVDYVGFTGGAQTGRKVALAASERLIPFSLELGGKNPMIVLEGASLDEAASGLLAGAFSNSGQTCISIERVYVQESIYEDFTRRIAEKTKRLKLGWSKAWDIDMGSLISATHVDKVMMHVDGAIEKGARVLAGGKRRTDLGSTFVEPTILANVRADMPVFREETFGPVVSVFPFRTAEEGIARANDSEYGLNASIWARDGNHSKRVARQLETGSAVINSTLLIYNTFDVPMGGVKHSGIGRRHGEHGILRYTQAQSIVASPAMGGGYDSVALRIKSEKTARRLLAVLKLWRRLGL